MSDRGDEEFDAEKYENATMTASVTTSTERDAEAEFLTWIKCDDGDCTNTENPAEGAWVKLMSAIPIEGQVSSMSCAATGFPTPSPGEIQTLVTKIRPDEPDQFAIRTLMNEWINFKRDFADNENTGVAGNLKAALTALSDGWQGDDFDAFAEQVEVVISNCDTITDEIGDESSGAVQILSQKWQEILALQGGEGGELPYPAPLYWIKDKGGLFSNPCIHVRVPFAPDGCEVEKGCMFGDGAESGALELGGFDSSIVSEAQQYVQAQTEYYLAEGANQDPPVTREQAERWAAADADRELGSVADVGEDDFEERASITNDDVVNRWQNAETAASEFTPTATPSEPSTFGDSAGDLDGSGYSPPGGGGGGGGLGPGGMPTGSGPSGLEPMDTPTPSGGLGGGGLPGGGLPGGSGLPGGGLDSDNPWSSGITDPDDISGGLAGGGPGGLGGGLGGGSGIGGGLGGGSGIGGGPGGGLGAGGAGGMMGAGGMGRGGGPGAGAGGRGGMKGGGMGAGGGMGRGGGTGAGAGAGGRGGGMGGGMMGGGGGARGMGGSENESGDDTWLVEDDDVWGIGNAEDDPYA